MQSVKIIAEYMASCKFIDGFNWSGQSYNGYFLIWLVLLSCRAVGLKDVLPLGYVKFEVNLSFVAAAVDKPAIRENNSHAHITVPALVGTGSTCSITFSIQSSCWSADRLGPRSNIKKRKQEKPIRAFKSLVSQSLTLGIYM